MSFGYREQARLYGQLTSSGFLPGEWRAAYWLAPRQRFIPDDVWRLSEDGDDVLIRKSVDPQAWLDFVYSDEVVSVQYDDGAGDPGSNFNFISSSSSMPSIVFDFLRHLDVHKGHRVLEIGTGTGWNAALLAVRLGDGNVTTIEVDRVLADRARKSLAEAGYAPAVICGDGEKGWPERAPYDRIVATCAIQRVPYAWVEQTRPGGIVLTPWGNAFDNGGLLELRVGDDGTATGGFTNNTISFMWLRAQRKPLNMRKKRILPEHDYDETTSKLWPGHFLYEPGRFGVGVRVPHIQTILLTDDPEHYTAYFLHPASGSWAIQTPDFDNGHYRVRQHGPRRLFDEVAEAYEWWDNAGRPDYTRFTVTVTPEGQTVLLDGVPVIPRQPPAEAR